jgi:hypothetical protein
MSQNLKIGLIRSSNLALMNYLPGQHRQLLKKSALLSSLSKVRIRLTESNNLVALVNEPFH